MEKSEDGVLGFQTLGRMMVCADETTELWRPKVGTFLNYISISRTTFLQY